MENQTIAEKPAPEARIKPWRVWAARVVTVLAALGTFTAFAAFGHPWSSIPILITYGVVLALLLRKRASPRACGMQLGVGTAGTAFSLRLLLGLFGFGAWAGEAVPAIGIFLLAALLNFLMFRSALDVPLFFTWDRNGRVKYVLNSFVMFVVASGCWYAPDLFGGP